MIRIDLSKVPSSVRTVCVWAGVEKQKRNYALYAKEENPPITLLLCQPSFFLCPTKLLLFVSYSIDSIVVIACCCQWSLRCLFVYHCFFVAVCLRLLPFFFPEYIYVYRKKKHCAKHNSAEPPGEHIKPLNPHRFVLSFLHSSFNPSWFSYNRPHHPTTALPFRVLFFIFISRWQHYFQPLSSFLRSILYSHPSSSGSFPPFTLFQPNPHTLNAQFHTAMEDTTIASSTKPQLPWYRRLNQMKGLLLALVSMAQVLNPFHYCTYHHPSPDMSHDVCLPLKPTICCSVRQIIFFWHLRSISFHVRVDAGYY